MKLPTVNNVRGKVHIVFIVTLIIVCTESVICSKVMEQINLVR